MKTFRSLSAAVKAANGLPVILINNHGDRLYIVGVDALTEIALLTPNGGYAGNVTARHLDRLGNANHAIAQTPLDYTAFPAPGSMTKDQIVTLETDVLRAILSSTLTERFSNELAWARAELRRRGAEESSS